MPELPESPNLNWLRKEAKRLLTELRTSNPSAQLADAQFAVAKEYGFSSWRALKAHIDALALDGQLFEAAQAGDVTNLASLLDTHPEKLHVRNQPYEWSLLHAAAHKGHLAAVELLLARGLDPNTREKGDNTYAMHWAAAAAHLDIVRVLAGAGGDVVGKGDDHQLEVIGWATCWDGTDDGAHRAVAEFLVSRGARHHIFSAIAMRLPNEVRRIVAANPAALNTRQSRNENHRTPLHFAVTMNRPDMVALLLELGADPLAVDGTGQPIVIYASEPDTDRPVMEKIRELTASELLSAARGDRPPRAEGIDLIAVLALHDWETAERLVRENPRLIERGRAAAGVLHLMAKRGDAAAVQWLLDRGADPNALWSHWDAEVTPMHLAAWHGHADVVRLLLGAGANPLIRDSKHDSDVIGWAEFFHQAAIVDILKGHGERT